MDRRTFVKACAATAGAGALASGGFTLLRPLAQPRAASERSVRYLGAHRVGGPPPVGVPYVPITMRDGVLVAKEELSLRGRRIDVLQWHRFCGRRDSPALSRDAPRDNTLVYMDRPEYHDLVTPWFKPRIGEPVRPEHFEDVGFAADFTWRSAGVAEEHALAGIIVRVGSDSFRRVMEPGSPGEPLTDAEWDLFREEIAWGDFVAVSSFCTHFCCLAGWKLAEKLARPRSGWDNVFCTCHNGNFDPRTPVAYRYFPDAAVRGIDVAAR